MQAYGYAVDDWDSEMPMRLREATLTCSIEDLRRIRKFISDVLVEREAAGMVDGHEHFRDRDAAWSDDESDLVIVFQK